MCKVGDIIVVKEYTHNGQVLDKHSFVVLSDESGTIQGLDYDIICNVMSSFKDNAHKTKKLRYPGNFPVTYNDVQIKTGGNSKDGFIKAEQLYYFKKDTLDYIVIGTINEEVFNLLVNFIENLDVELSYVIDNL